MGSSLNDMNNITRIKNDNFTTISNVFLRDKNLSVKSKGFLAIIMALPNDWDFSINGICSILKEGKTAIYNIIDELKLFGYCSVVKTRNEKGVILGNDYTFYEEPNIASPHSDYPYPENPNMDNQPQLNTNSNKEYNNKEYTNKEIEDKSSIKKEDQIDYALIENEWNTICSKLPNVRGISPKRKTAIKNTLKNNNANANDLIKCFKIIASSDFLNGNNSRKWCATFDWITTDTKGCFNRLLEGEFSKSPKEHKLYEDIINDANIANKETNSKEITIINGIKYQ